MLPKDMLILGFFCYSRDMNVFFKQQPKQNQFMLNLNINIEGCVSSFLYVNFYGKLKEFKLKIKSYSSTPTARAIF